MFIVRRATVDDVAVIHLMVQTFNMYMLKEEFVEWTTDDRHVVLVAEENQLIGFLLGIRQSQSWVMLESLYIHPDHRGKGVARALCDLMVSSLPADTFISTFVDVDDEGTSTAMRRCGFKSGKKFRWMSRE